MAKNPDKRDNSARENGLNHGNDGSSTDQFTIRTAIPAIKDLTFAFWRDPGTPPYLKALCWAGAIGEIMVLSLSTILIGSSNPVLGFSLAVLGVSLLALIIWLVFSLVARGLLAVASHNSSPAPVRPDPIWTRLVPQIPIKEELLEQIHERLENIRSLAYETLERFNGKPHPIKRDYIRANIFLPDTSALATEGICELFIPKKCHVGMNPADDNDRDRCERERTVRFKPNQGAAGIAFMETKSEIGRVVKIASTQFVWSEKYSLTDTQKRAIHPELKWVISFPLTVNDRGRPRAMGVLNVDGLICELEENDLKILVGELTLSVAVISSLLGQNEKCRVSSYIESV